MTYDEWEEWDVNYKGQLMTLTRDELVDHLSFDAEDLTNANHHGASESMSELAEMVRQLPESTPIAWFAWSVNDLGPLRQCIVSS